MLLIAMTKSGQQHRFREIRQLTPEEELAYRTAIQHLNEFRAASDVLPLVDANCDELLRLVHRVLTTPGGDLARGQVLRATTVESNRLLVNFLASARLYLDHEETRLKRRYGTLSAEVRAFETAVKAQFDAEPAYRIAYKLRNFVLHCGMPIQSIGLASSRSEIPGGPPAYEISVACKTKDLLDRYDGWGSTKPDLIAAGEQIDVGPLAEKFNQSLHVIEEATVAAERAALGRSATVVRRLLAEVQEPQTVPAVVDIANRDDGSGTIKFYEAPADLLEALTRDKP